MEISRENLFWLVITLVVIQLQQYGFGMEVAPIVGDMCTVGLGDYKAIFSRCTINSIHTAGYTLVLDIYACARKIFTHE